MAVNRNLLQIRNIAAVYLTIIVHTAIKISGVVDFDAHWKSMVVLGAFNLFISNSAFVVKRMTGKDRVFNLEHNHPLFGFFK